MKSLSYLLLPIFLLLFQCSTEKDLFTGVIQENSTSEGSYKIKTVYNNQIPSQIRKKVYSNHLLFMAALQTKEKDVLKKVLSSTIHDNDIDKIYDIIQNHGPFEDLVLLDEYYSIVESKGDISYPILPDRNSIFIINSVTVKNREIYNVFQVSQGSIYQQLYHTFYVLEEGLWKVASFSTGLYTIGKRNTVEWHNLAKQSFFNANPFVAYYGSTISNKLQRTIHYLQFRDEKELALGNNEILKSSFSLINNPEFFYLSEKDELIGFDFDLSIHGIIPIIMYAGNMKNKDKDDLDGYAKKMCLELDKNYPDTKEIFKVICFLAFENKHSDIKLNKPFHISVVELKTNTIIYK